MMGKVFIGTIDGPMDWRVHVEDDGVVAPLDPGYKHGVNHSPDGFAWGYGGSGPAQLAFAILANLYGPAVARANYQKFKWAVIAGLEMDKPWRLAGSDLAAWGTAGYGAGGL